MLQGAHQPKDNSGFGGSPGIVGLSFIFLTPDRNQPFLQVLSLQ